MKEVSGYIEPHFVRRHWSSDHVYELNRAEPSSGVLKNAGAAVEFSRHVDGNIVRFFVFLVLSARRNVSPISRHYSLLLLSFADTVGVWF